MGFHIRGWWLKNVITYMRFQYLNPLENFWALTLSRVHREEKPFLTFLCKIDILEKRELRNIAPPTHKYTHPHLKKNHSHPPPLYFRVSLFFQKYFPNHPILYDFHNENRSRWRKIDFHFQDVVYNPYLN